MIHVIMTFNRRLPHDTSRLVNKDLRHTYAAREAKRQLLYMPYGPSRSDSVEALHLTSPIIVTNQQWNGLTYTS